MTRCVICDKNLKDHEAVRRHALTNEFLDICDGCLKEIPGLPTKSPAGMIQDSDPFEHCVEDTEGNVDVNVEGVTNCYTLDDD
jgi:hypothetical protein